MILDYVNKTFNNREIALISYLLIFIIWALTQKKIRKSFMPVVKAIMAWKILASIFALVIYVALVVYGLFKIGLWDKSLIKDSIYWTLGVGLVIMMSFDKALKEEHYFKNLVKENFKVLLIIEFIVGLYVFGIITEFILMPFVILFSMLLGYTEIYKEHEQVRKLINGLFGILGTVYLIYSGYHIYSDFNGFATTGNLKIFLFPILMSILFLPFAYTYALLVHFESLFVRLGFFLKDKKLRRFAKWRILLSVNFSILRLKRMTPGMLFIDCKTKNDIKEEIRNKLKPSS
ncbi:MAG: hypothetical protein GYA02_09830 [Clostridiaceae bacterium]|jgi:hypothetical protein|nr:hypothetical protein [Clostridiaceae bacterium]